MFSIFSSVKIKKIARNFLFYLNIELNRKNIYLIRPILNLKKQSPILDYDNMRQRTHDDDYCHWKEDFSVKQIGRNNSSSVRLYEKYRLNLISYYNHT
jgi:hypothetical protein